MPVLKFQEVLAYSSEDPNHAAENLLMPDTYLKWKSKPGHNETQEYVTLKLEKLTSIRSVDIGNEHSAFVEVLVAREGTVYQVLLVASSFMSPLESRNGTAANRVRMFGFDKLNKNIAEQKWDRIKVICTQPFNKNVQYGLAFIKVYGPEIKENSSNISKLGRFTLNEEDSEEDDIAVGSFFAKRSEKETTLTGAAAIRAASKAQLTQGSNSSSKRSAEDSSNPPDVGFYQLKKKAKVECQENKLEKQNAETKVIKNTKEDKTTKENNKERRINGNKATEKRKDKLDSPSSHSQKKNAVHERAEKSTKRKPAKRRKTLPFNQLMSDVIFVMSGYQNPKRGQLRDWLIAMGARYKTDWSPACTHLICAFKNTPKFTAVKGKGRIVSEKWIEDSYKKKIRFPWRRYNLEKNPSDAESEEEIWSTEICPKDELENKASCELSDDEQPENGSDEAIVTSRGKESPVIRTKKESPRKEEMKVERNKISTTSSDEDYDADTDVDEEPVLRKETSHLKLPPLKNFFLKKTFFLYGTFDDAKRKSLQRYIVAFSGSVSNYMTEEVNFVVTESSWDDNFNQALDENSSLQFVKPQWIWKCCDEEKIVPAQPYLIVPQDL